MNLNRVEGAAIFMPDIIPSGISLFVDEPERQNWSNG